MKRRLATLALALLFLLPGCSRQAKDDAYHWTPPEKKIVQTAADDGYDPASGMTYEEYLATIDAPIVVTIERISGTAPLLDLTREPASSALQKIRNSPYVTDMSFPTLLHWMGNSIKSVPSSVREVLKINRYDPPSIEEATLVIGQIPYLLQSEQLEEGRVWENMFECCVNRALYDKLCNDPKAEFSKLGDSIRLEEIIAYTTVRRYSDGQQEAMLGISATDSFNLTVVGIVDDERGYANVDVYGVYHIYAPLETVEALIGKHDFTHPSYDDQQYYQISSVVQEHIADASMLFSRFSAENPSKKEIRLPGGKVIPEEDWLAIWADVPTNAGYLVEITLDSGKHYAEFLEYMNTTAQVNSAQYMYDYQVNMYKQQLTSTLNIPPLVQEIADDGELDDWYYYPLVPREVRPLRVAP